MFAAITAAIAADTAAADDVVFDAVFFSGLSASHLAKFAQGNPLEPGIRNVDVVFNGERVRRSDVAFVEGATAHAAQPRLSPALLRQLGLKPEVLAAVPLEDEDALIDLPTAVEGAKVHYDDSSLTLSVSVPQAALQRTARGFVAPDLRDSGVRAAFIDYNGSTYQSSVTRSSYLGVSAGVNLGPWRLRHRSALRRGSNGAGTEVLSNALQRDLPDWSSQLLLGQGTTSGQLFDGVAFTGVQVASDERMLPDSLRGYAPVVRGVAHGTATVAIRQNGGLIHEATVPPGPFVIDDLYPTSGAGGLEVTVTEADGRVEQFNVPFSAVPQALREGSRQSSVTVGRLRQPVDRIAPLAFLEATHAYGLGNRLTALGGVQVAQGYSAALLGGALNTGWGAWGADITHARARLGSGPTLQGQSYRLNFQRSIPRTGSSFGLAAYRYSTDGFLGLGDAARLADDRWSLPDESLRRTRNRYQVNFTQQVGAASQLYLSGGRTSYWQQTRHHDDLQLGFHSRWGRASYSLSANRFRTSEGVPDTRYVLSVHVPMGRDAHAPHLSSTLSRVRAGTQSSVGVSGGIGRDGVLAYSLNASQGQGERSHGAYGHYHGNKAHVTASYSHGNGTGSTGVGLRGGMVLHAGGMNLAPALGDSFALVRAQGARGAQVNGVRTAVVAGNDHAVLPSTQPYRWNTFALDVASLSLDAEVEGGSQRIAPTAGSIVRVEFIATTERTVFVDATTADGQPLPFGAPVHDAQGRLLAYVGQGGIIQLRGLNAPSTLWVALADGNYCQMAYEPPPDNDTGGLLWTRARCTAGVLVREDPTHEDAFDTAAPL